MNRNTATDNAFSGISLTRSSVEAGFSRNVAKGNGTGIDSFDSHGHYAANVTNANRGRGLVIRDSVFETHGPFFTVSRHVANANGGVGVSVFSGVIDGGGNRARANRAAAQCEYLVCK